MDVKDGSKWFKPKQYGYGWTPISWQGWFTVGAYLAINISGAYLLLSHQPKSDSLNWLKWLTLGLIILSTTLIQIGISIARGGMPRWQWGDKIVKKRK